MFKKLIFIILFCIIATIVYAEKPIEDYSDIYIKGACVSLNSNRTGAGGEVRIIINTQTNTEYHIYIPPFNKGGVCLLSKYSISSSRVRQWQNQHK